MRSSLAAFDLPASARPPLASAELDSSAGPAPAAPDPYTPPCRTVRAFPPIRGGRGGGGGRRFPRALRWRRRRLALGITVASGILAVSAAYSPAPAKSLAARSTASPPAARHTGASTKDPLVKAPVRIADAAAVRLLRPGDHVDVLAAAHVVAAGVEVLDIPGDPDPRSSTPAYVEGAVPSGAADIAGAGGALVVLYVPRHVAAALSGASASSPLAVALC